MAKTENQKIKCPNCGEEIIVRLNEFVDVSIDPIYKEKILGGEFFVKKCPKCKDEILLEYPIMYMDPKKRLNIYMVPDHDEDLLEQLNSLDIPQTDVEEEVFRVVDDSTELLEKILVFDNDRDDRIIELYKAVLCEKLRKDVPTITPDDILYMSDSQGEFFVVWSSNNDNGEKLTLELDEGTYKILDDNYKETLEVPFNKYVQIDQNWLLDRVQFED